MHKLLFLGFSALSAAFEDQILLATTTATPTQSATLQLDIKPISTAAHSTILATAVARVIDSPHVQSLLNGADHRLLFVDRLHSSGTTGKKEGNSFRAVIADYTNGRTIYASSDDAFLPGSEASVVVTNDQPVPDIDELKDAAAIAGFGADANVHKLMPPVIQTFQPNGSSSRTLHFLAGQKGSDSLKPVYVNMNARTAVTSAAPLASTTSAADPGPTCSAAWLGVGLQPNPRSLPDGKAVVVIKQGDTVLWELEVTRPSSSSGSKGSGVELTNVYYKGKLVLKRAHVPILNVNYLEKKNYQHGTICGPSYRDWQWQEWPFECEGTDSKVADFRRCTSPSQTFIDRAEDKGNFKGVAFDVRNDEVVIRSQIIAGWYRYVSEWHLKVDGTILPRWGFGGVHQQGLGCVCVQHHHHAYWRFDFDIESSISNEVHEIDNPPAPGKKTNHKVEFLGARFKAPAVSRYWEIVNSLTKRSYALYPGQTDEKYDPKDPRYPSGFDSMYSKGDLWIAKYDPLKGPEQYDDGVTAIEGDGTTHDITMANFDTIVGRTTESLEAKDVVIWYSASFMHHQDHDEGKSHVVGPALRPVTW